MGKHALITGQALSPHAGPQTQALQLDADPLAAPLVPDIGISPPPELGTAVGAAFFAMMQHYGEGVTPGAFQVRVPLDSHLHVCPLNVCAACSSCNHMSELCDHCYCPEAATSLRTTILPTVQPERASVVSCRLGSSCTCSGMHWATAPCQTLCVPSQRRC